MSGKSIIVGITVILLFGAGIFSPEHSASAETMHTLSHANNTFAWDLYAQLKTEKGNLFFSPYSISSALAMAYAGAQGNTKAQMAKTLHFPLENEDLHAAFHELAQHVVTLQKNGSVTLNVANSLWVEQTIELLKAFTETTQTYYDANLFQVDFTTAPEACRTRINEWVADKTAQKIPELLHAGDVTSDTTFVLTNAIYFKGDWLNPFDAQETSAGDFWTDASTSISVPTMHLKGSFEYTEDTLAQVAALPYAGEDLYMLFVLPQTKNGLADLETQMNAERIDTWLKQLLPQKLDLALPKFTMRSRFSLLPTLTAMGFTDPSDFSGISNPAFPLSNVIHEAFIDVNEQGTEAAAASAATFGRSLPRYVNFYADHPFLYFIYDSTSRSILFLGRVVDPSAE